MPPASAWAPLGRQLLYLIAVANPINKKDVAINKLKIIFSFKVETTSKMILNKQYKIVVQNNLPRKKTFNLLYSKHIL